MTSPTTNGPTYTHDCDSCQYLATVSMYGRDWDLYVCLGTRTSLVGRDSNYPPDYTSHPLPLPDVVGGPVRVAYEIALSRCHLLDEPTFTP
jgi:hypothetical protein